MQISKAGLILVVAATVFTHSFSISKAEDLFSANYHLSHCQAAANMKARPTLEQAECYGMIKTITSLNGRGKLTRHSRFCSPQGSTIVQYLRVVIRFVKQRPNRHHEPFAVLALEALRTAWPCR